MDSLFANSAASGSISAAVIVGLYGLYKLASHISQSSCWVQTDRGRFCIGMSATDAEESLLDRVGQPK